MPGAWLPESAKQTTMKIVLSILFSLLASAGFAADSTAQRQSEIIYGRKDGMALTMIKLDPSAKSNGKAIIRVVSGNWKSDYNRLMRSIDESELFSAAGYTVFAVVPSSQPRYNMTDAVADIKRAVRFIRYHAREYNIDPGHIGITGSSSGGHLSLLVSTMDDMPVQDGDPVNAVSARVQAAVVFFPPTDFSNFGRQQMDFAMMQKVLVLTGVAGAFDYKEWNDSTQTFRSVTDPKKKQEIARNYSPVNHVSADDPPVLFLHGDKDMLVPMQQSNIMVTKYREAGLQTDLIIHPNAGHGWRPDASEEKKIIGWFDRFLK